MDVEKERYFECPNCHNKLTKSDLRTEVSFRILEKGVKLDYIRIFCRICGHMLKEVVKDGEGGS